MVLFSATAGADADVTYAEIEFSPMKKERRMKGRSK